MEAGIFKLLFDLGGATYDYVNAKTQAEKDEAKARVRGLIDKYVAGIDSLEEEEAAIDRKWNEEYKRLPLAAPAPAPTPPIVAPKPAPVLALDAQGLVLSLSPEVRAAVEAELAKRAAVAP